MQSFLLNATQLFSCDSSNAQKSVSSSPVSASAAATGAQGGSSSSVAERASSALAAAAAAASDSKSGPSNCVLMQGWMLMAMAVSVFVPRNSRILWFLRTHFARNRDSK